MTQPQTDKLDDHHRQQLSAMLDGELLPDQAKFMLRRLEHDGELAACWERWQVCGEILRGRRGALLPADFSRRVADAIVDQHDAAPAADAVAATTRHPRWARWGGGAALAASVAMAALFVGRQAPAPGPEPIAPTQVVASASTPSEAPAMPAPAPAAPTQAPDTASTLATAVAAAEIPRRAAERRAARSQQQRAASRVRRAAQAPVTVAVAAGAPGAASPLVADASPAPAVLAEAGSRSSATVTELFTTSPTQPRPWPRAILPGFPAQDAFTVGYGGMAQEQHPFHPFEPRVEMQPAPAEPQPAASGPR